MDFIAFDFETANVHQSPCSLGITLVENGNITDCYSYLINPKEPFSNYNIKVNGIHPEDVANSPEFPEIWSKISNLFTNYPLVAHNAAFDRSVLLSTLTKYNIEIPKMKFYCTMRLAQMNLPNLNGYGLANLCEYFNVNLTNHHCCDADSTACACILLKMMKYPDFKLSPLQDKQSYSHNTNYHHTEPIYKEPNTKYDEILSSDFEGKAFVITGKIGNYERKDLIKTIENFGGLYRTSVSRKIDYLIVGVEDLTVIKNKENVKSEKILKAEKIRKDGYPIKIISQQNFLYIIEEKLKAEKDNSSNWLQFKSYEDKCIKLKHWDLMPKTFSIPKQLYYNGIYCSKLVKCEIVGYEDENVVVIKFNNSLHKIDVDYLKEMQPTEKEVAVQNV